MNQSVPYTVQTLDPHCGSDEFSTVAFADGTPKVFSTPGIAIDHVAKGGGDWAFRVYSKDGKCVCAGSVGNGLSFADEQTSSEITRAMTQYLPAIKHIATLLEVYEGHYPKGCECDESTGHICDACDARQFLYDNGHGDLVTPAEEGPDESAVYALLEQPTGA